MSAAAPGRTADPGKAWRAGHGIPVVPAFDGFRALAIAGVVLFHVLQVSGGFLRAGDSGLAVVLWAVLPRTLEALFIISGFVIYMPTVARSGDFERVRAFAVRRAARLFPGYYVALAVAIVLLLTVSRSSGVPGAGPIVLHVLVLQTPAQLWDSHLALGLGVIPPVWTLSVEIGFYVVLPLIAGWWYRRPFVGLALAAVVLVAWRELLLHAGDVAGWFGADLSSEAQRRLAAAYGSQFPNWAVALGAGMTAAWLYVRLRARWAPAVLERRALAGAGLSAVALAAIAYTAGHGAVHDANPFLGLFSRQSILVAVGYPIALAALLVAIALGPGWLRRPFSGRLMSRAADISYGVYLIHFAVIFFAVHELALPHGGGIGAVAAWAAVVYPASFAYAWLSAKFVERPVRRWAHRFGRRAQSEERAYAPA